MFIVLGCIEQSSWYTVVGNYKCVDYLRNKWCENGGVGSAWNPTWQWNLGNNGEDARTMCCECGGGQKGNIKNNSAIDDVNPNKEKITLTTFV